MDSEAFNKLLAQTSAIELVVTMLLSDALKRLSHDDAVILQTVLSPTMQPPEAPNIDTADHWAGRTLEYQRVLARILSAAQEIAHPTTEQKR